MCSFTVSCVVIQLNPHVKRKTETDLILSDAFLITNTDNLNTVFNKHRENFLVEKEDDHR